MTGILLARNATRNLVALGVPMAVALVALPLIVERLGTARFGVLGLVWIFFGLFGELGMGRATTKYAAEAFAVADGRRVRGVLRIGLVMQLMLGLVLAGALALAAPALAARAGGAAGLAAETQSVLLLVALSLPAVMVAAAYRGVLEAAHRFDLVNRVRIPLAVATYLLPALLLLAGYGLVAITAILAGARAVGTGAYGWLAMRLLGDTGADGAVAAPRASGMIAFGAWQTAGGFLTPVLVHADRFLLAGIAGVAAVGLYTPAFEVATRLLILPAGVVMALFPAFSAWSAAEQSRSARAAARAVLYIIAALVPPVVLVLALGADALRLWLTSEFAGDTAVALAILSCGALVNAAAFVPATLLQGAGRPDIPTKLYLAELLPYLALVVVLVGRWGVAGAAAAWSIRVTVDAVLLFWATHSIGILPFGEMVRARVPQSMLVVTSLALAPAAAVATIGDVWIRALAATFILAGAGVFLATYALRADGRSRVAQALGLT